MSKDATPRSTSITEFLLARIDEDEQRLDAPDFIEDPDSVRSPGWGNRGECPICGAYQFDGTETVTEEAWFEHAEQAHQRSRMLAECRAKRAIIAVSQDRHYVNSDDGWYSCHAARLGVDTDDENALAVETPGDCTCGSDGTTPVLRHLATVYASHPAYNKAWRP